MISFEDWTRADELLAKRYMCLARWFEVCHMPEQAEYYRRRFLAVRDRIEMILDIYREHEQSWVKKTIEPSKPVVLGGFWRRVEVTNG